MPATQYRFEARNADEPDEWHETTEDYVRERLRRDDPVADLDVIIEAMKHGDEANDDSCVFRAVPITLPADLRIIYTVAPAVYDGFGTITIDPAAGTTIAGRVIRKVGIRPDAWEWQTTRYWSGSRRPWTEEEVRQCPAVFRMNDLGSHSIL